MTKFAKLFDKALSKIEDKFKIDIPKYREKLMKKFDGDIADGYTIDIFPRDEATLEFKNKGDVVKSVIIVPSFNTKKDTKKVQVEIDKFLKTV